MKAEGKEYYRREEAAAYLSISVRTLDQLKHDGEMPFCKIGMLVLFMKQDMDEFMMSKRISVGEE